jgi:hypothetical protein
MDSAASRHYGQHRYHHHIEHEKEACIGDGSANETELLNDDAEKEHQADGGERTRPRERDRGPALLLSQREGQHRDSGERKARPGKNKRPQMRHRRLLTDECKTPNECGDQ